MAIVNRDLDPSQQISVFEQTVYGGVASGVSAGIFTPGVATGRTYVLMNVPSPMQLSAASVAAFGVSGSPVHSIWLYRFAGGFTSMAVGQTLAVQGYGTSGAQSVSLFAAATFLLQAGDLLALYTQGSNAAVDSVTVSLAVKALQDIKSTFGVTS